MGKMHTETPVYSREVGLDMKIEYSSNNAIYIGEAFPGGAAAAAVWRIQKLAYDGSGNMTDKRWADGTDEHSKVWNDRASYTYLGI